jgi:hypothetical protein
MIPNSFKAIWVAKNHMMNANATLTNAGLAFTVTWEPMAEPMMHATEVTAINL